MSGVNRLVARTAPRAMALQMGDAPGPPAVATGRRLVVREAVAADADDLVGLAVQFLQESGYHVHVGINRIALGLLVQLVLERGVVFVTVVDGELVGMLAAMVAPHPMSGQLAGSEVCAWVDPAHRGSSAFARMHGEAVAWARLWGAKTFQMIAPAGTSAGRLYERLGYVEVETTFQLTLT